MGLENVPVVAQVFKQPRWPRSELWCAPPTSVQRAVGVEQAEGRGEFLLGLRPCQANLREAKCADRLLPVLTGTPTQKGELL